jgi:hypothetical protein
VTYMTNYRIGRIGLHIAAMIGDRHAKWHLAGIRRELPLVWMPACLNGATLSALFVINRQKFSKVLLMQ